MPIAKRSFQYQTRSKDDVKARANMRGGNFDSFLKPQYKLLKIKDGKNLIRILPPTWEKPTHYGYDIYVNYGVGVDNQSYLSLSKMKNEKDPLAEARKEAQRDGDEKLARALEARQRILMWVIDRMEEDEGPQLWAAPFTLDKALANVSFDEDTKEVVYIDSPEDGCDVRFSKEGTGMLTKYPAEKIKLLKPSPLHEDEGLANEWLEFVQENPIPDCLNYYDYEHIASVFNGHARVDEDDQTERKPRANLKPVAEDPPWDEDDEEVKPRRTSSTAAPEKASKKPQLSRRDDEDEEAEASDEVPQKSAGQSIRERLQARRTPVSSKRSVDPDDDE